MMGSTPDLTAEAIASSGRGIVARSDCAKDAVSAVRVVQVWIVLNADEEFPGAIIGHVEVCQCCCAAGIADSTLVSLTAVRRLRPKIRAALHDEIGPIELGAIQIFDSANDFTCSTV